MNHKFYQQIWQYIRIMKYFSFFDLQILLVIDKCTLNNSELGQYLNNLVASKILKKLKNDSFELRKDLGEYAPIFMANNILYNPNNNKNIFLNNESNHLNNNQHHIH